MTKVKSYKEIEDNPQVLGEPVTELEKFIATRPADVDFTDNDIMEELYKVRYDK